MSIPIFEQGGLERFQREAHNLDYAGSSPAPATKLQTNHKWGRGDRRPDGESAEGRNDVKSARRPLLGGSR